MQDDKVISLFKVLIDLIKYVSLKESLNIKDDILTTLFKDPGVIDENGEKILFKSTKWDEQFLTIMCSRFGWDKSELGLSKFLRINEAFDLVKSFDVSIEFLLKWTTNKPTDITINEIKNLLRTKYDESDWLSVIQPISDRLRNSQRNGLVSFILTEMQKNDQTKNVNTPDKLFEYFLIDVQMDPCMKTSRIKQAISTVQLFIQQCLLNLEPEVSSSSIKKNQWEWMKRYRIWEVNRINFLRPENLLETELRDVKSSFFSDLEGELLQADINDELAENSLLKYLEKLDDVSKLEISCMFLAENEAGNKADDILHVFGRTTGASRKYYYRRFEYGYWTPWEKIDIDIEDNPVMPIVWKNRLFLFWLNVIVKGKSDNHFNGKNDDDNVTTLKILNLVALTKESVEITLSWSEYYNNKWQPRKTSDLNNPIRLIDSIPKNTFDRQQIKIIYYFDDDQALNILPRYEGNIGGTFKLYNKHSAFIDKDSRYDPQKLKQNFIYREFDDTKSTLSIIYKKVTNSIISETIINDILQAQEPHNIVSNDDYVSNIFETPFFYQNGKHVFFVEQEKSLIKLQKIDYVFTGRNFLDDIKPNIEFTPLWTKPHLVWPLSLVVKDPLINNSINLRSGRPNDPNPINFENANNSLNKVILDNKIIVYDNVEIGPMGSKNARLLYDNEITTDSNFERVGRMEEM